MINTGCRYGCCQILIIYLFGVIPKETFGIAPFLLYKCPFVQSECLIASYLSITSTVVPIYEIKRQDARKSIQ